MVWSLTIDRGFTTLAAFTRSRGAWAWPLPTTPSGASADLEVAISGPANAEPGTRVDYTVTVTNHGPDAAANVQLDSPLPAGLGFVANSGDCSGAYPCVFLSVPSGGTQTVTSTVCVPHGYAGANPIALNASASSDAADPAGANDYANANVPLSTEAVFADSFESCP
jgi:uncharacterized repeat protein (TIGR01451 family)